MTDLLKLIPDDKPIVVELKHPETAEPLDATITVCSQYSDQFKDIMYQMVDNLNEGKKSTKESVEETIDMWVNRTISWDMELGGKRPKFTKAKAKDIYSKLPWLVAQLNDAVEEQEAFTQA